MGRAHWWGKVPGDAFAERTGSLAKLYRGRDWLLLRNGCHFSHVPAKNFPKWLATEIKGLGDRRLPIVRPISYPFACVSVRRLGFLCQAQAVWARGSPLIEAHIFSIYRIREGREEGREKEGRKIGFIPNGSP